MESSKENDFTVHVIGFDVVRLPLQALPRGSTLSGLARDCTDAEKFASTALVFGFRNIVNAGGLQTGDTLLTSPGRERPRADGGSAKGFACISKIHQKFAVLPPHDVGADF